MTFLKNFRIGVPCVLHPEKIAVENLKKIQNETFNTEFISIHALKMQTFFVEKFTKRSSICQIIALFQSKNDVINYFNSWSKSSRVFRVFNDNVCLSAFFHIK